MATPPGVFLFSEVEMPDARFSEDFWTDPKIRAMDMDTQRLFIYLFTNPHRNYCGLYYLPKSFIREQTGLSDRSIDRGIDTLSQGGLIEYSEDYQMVFVKNMLKRQAPGYINDKQIKGIENHLNRLHGCPLIKSFLDLYSSLNIKVSYTPIHTPMDVQSQSKSQSQSEKPLVRNPSHGDNGFDIFWNEYPKKIGKKDAKLAWRKAKDKPSIEKIVASLKLQMQSDQWLKDDGQFIPHPTTWIRKGRWDDEITTSPITPTPNNPYPGRCKHLNPIGNCPLCEKEGPHGSPRTA